MNQMRNGVNITKDNLLAGRFRPLLQTILIPQAHRLASSAGEPHLFYRNSCGFRSIVTDYPAGQLSLNYTILQEQGCSVISAPPLLTPAPEPSAQEQLPDMRTK